ncbi:MAG: L-seryl-tRNA(Sec) selenium transferase [Anaerolineaceae bacterium]|nr:L-seryl-tRNA(Sec) selenium transferase [Anaerolineaceae bacterium]
MPEPRALPSVHYILQDAEVQHLMDTYGRKLVTEQIRKIEENYRIGTLPGTPELKKIVIHLQDALTKMDAMHTAQVINATGVILHTNLGRAPLSKAVLQAISLRASGYQSLEFNLSTGKRGHRAQAAESLLTQLTGAEAALVVNNNASAMLLILTALLKRKSVAISRGQMVEIGGGFRMPDLFRQSGAKLAEVGTTNRVSLQDYEEAISSGAQALLCVNPSNYKITGFSAAPQLQELAALAKTRQILSVFDLGSGALLDTSEFGLAHEPTVQESLSAGFDLISFSGDKLLGGPQAGIILGKAELIQRMKKHSLFRAMRADKLSLLALETTLKHYLFGQAVAEIPLWQMISRSKESIQRQALYLQGELRFGQLIPGFSTVGGGSLPEETLPTTLLSFSEKPEKMLKLLREGSPSVIARIENNKLIIDPRTVQPDEEQALLYALHKSLNKITR